MGVVLRAHPVHWESHIQRNASREVTTISPPFYNGLHRSHVLFVKSAPGMIFTSWSQNHFCCDSKARAAGVQSFTLWQQATVGITRHNYSIIACSRHLYMGVILHARPVRGESHIQHNASGEVATPPSSSRQCNIWLWCMRSMCYDSS